MTDRIRTTLFVALLGCLLLAAATPAAAHTLAADEASAPPPTELPPNLQAALIRALAAQLPEGVERPMVCFAPDTPREYAEEITGRFSRGPEPLFQGQDISKYRLDDRWITTASGGGLGLGDPTVLTWSYVPDGLSIPGFAGEPTSNSNLFAWLNGIYGNFGTWHALFVQIFDRWSELAGVTYIYEPNDDGAAFAASAGILGVRGDVRVGAHLIDGNSGILAYNFFPDTGDMVIDSADAFYNTTTSNSLRMRNVLAHEHGHGLGMSHVCPVEQSKLMEPFASTAFDGPQHDDIRAGSRGYGDFFENNDTFLTATDLASGDVTITDLSIDDTGDQDFYAVTVTGPRTFDITVTPIGLSYLEGPQVGQSCTPGTLIDSLDDRDLAVALLDTDGISVLDSADANGAGTGETISFAVAGAGTYFVRVDSSDVVDEVQIYDMTVDTGSQIFTDGFESGNTSAWDATVP